MTYSGLFSIKPNQIIYIQYICKKRIWYLINYNGSYAIKPNQTNREREREREREKHTHEQKKSQESFQICKWPYLPTPPLGKDTTQDQFLSGV